MGLIFKGGTQWITRGAMRSGGCRIAFGLFCRPRIRANRAGVPEAGAIQVEDFQIGQLLAVYVKPDGGDMGMEAFVPGGSGIDMHPAMLLVGHHFEDMRMPADEKVGFLGFEPREDAGRVMAGIAADMGHGYLASFAFKNPPFLEAEPNQVVIDIPIDGQRGLEGGQTIQHRQTTQIPGMPQALAGFQETEYLGEKFSMGVGQDAYFGHGGFSVIVSVYNGSKRLPGDTFPFTGMGRVFAGSGPG